jgi:hypothetical protein
MECPTSDQWRAKVMPEDPADWPPGTDGLVATMIRQQTSAEAIDLMDQFLDYLDTLAER